MQKWGINIAAPNLVCVCIDGDNDNDGWGRIYHCYSKEGERFSNSHQLIQIFENLMDCINYPQSSVQYRSFKESKREGRYKGKPIMGKEELLKNKGERGTFVVHVMYRQNATWQGEVVWTEKGEVRKFRSALELLKLIDSALEDGEIQAEENEE